MPALGIASARSRVNLDGQRPRALTPRDYAALRRLENGRLASAALLVVAAVCTLMGCTPPTRSALEPPPRADLDPHRMEARGFVLSGLTPEGAVDHCLDRMRGAEHELTAALAALEHDNSADAAIRAREALARWFDGEHAPLVLVDRDFAWHPDVLRACADSARVAARHELAVAWLRDLDRHGAPRAEDLRRLAWSLSAIGDDIEAARVLARIPPADRTAHDAQLEELLAVP